MRVLEAPSILDLADVDRIVPLETRPEAALGGVSGVKVDSSGELLVVDRDSTKAAYRFAADGRFLHKYGPLVDTGRSLQLMDVEPLDGKRLFVLAERRVGAILDDRTPASLTTTPYLPTFLARLGERLCTRSLRAEGGRSVACFSASGREESTFGVAEPRLERYLFAPIMGMASFRDRLYVGDYYRRRLVVFDSGGRQVATLAFDDAEDPLALAAWSHDPLTEDDRRTIRRRTRRLDVVGGYGQGLFLYSAGVRGEDAPRFIIYYPDDNLEYVTERMKWVSGLPGPGWAADAIVGSYDGGLIGVLNKPVTFTDLVALGKARGRSFRDVDNPMLVFLRLRSRQDLAARLSPRKRG